MSAALELQKAVYDALRLDSELLSLLAGTGVFDEVPTDTDPPYIVLSELETVDWSTASEAGEEHFFKLDIWSGKRGRKQVLQIADRVGRIVSTHCDTCPLVMNEHLLINLGLDETRTSKDEDDELWRSRLTLRAVTEPA